MKMDRVIAVAVLCMNVAVWCAQPLFAQEQEVQETVATQDAVEVSADDSFTAATVDSLATDTGDSSGTTFDEPLTATTSSSSNVTLDFKDADILLVLRLLSLKSGVNIVAGPEVTGTVTVRLNDVPWDKALDVVLRTYGYVYERDGSIVRVTTRENLEAEDLVTEAFVLNYSTATEIEEAIKEIVSERGRIKSVERTNTVLVTDVATNIYKIGEIIRRLDRRTPQVYIDSKIVETSRALIEKVGIDWSDSYTIAGTGVSRSHTFPFKGDAVEGYDAWYQQFFPNKTITAGTLSTTALQAAINFFESDARTKIISNPRIITLSNKPAKVQIGTEVAIPTYELGDSGSYEVTGYEMRETGVLLDVTPHVNDANEILVELKPELSNATPERDINGAGFMVQDFEVTKAETQVLIKNNETIVIGGLMRDAALSTAYKVPFLGDIPGIKRLFRYTEDSSTAGNNLKKETLFFVTVTIVDVRGQTEQEQ